MKEYFHIENNENLNNIKSVFGYKNEEIESEEVEMEQPQSDSNQTKENLFSKIRNTTSTHVSGNYSLKIAYLYS
jgi:hypothetical protein